MLAGVYCTQWSTHKFTLQERYDVLVSFTAGISTDSIFFRLYYYIFRHSSYLRTNDDFIVFWNIEDNLIHGQRPTDYDDTIFLQINYISGFLCALIYGFTPSITNEYLYLGRFSLDYNLLLCGLFILRAYWWE